MTVELGHFALILALVVAVVQGTLPLLGAARGRIAWMELARTAAVVQFALVALSFGCLVHAFVVSDFSVLNVAVNSHSTKPLLYKIAGAWGNHEGSMLLWVLILAVFGAAVAMFGRSLPPGLKARALAVQALIASGFYLFILFTSNPFTRVFPPPVDGQGLNPLLQDRGLAFHPPFLYLGYVGFSMAFSFAIAALIEGRVDAGWARWVRPWTLAAWTFLTIGIALGSWWAYYELGWGGWWYWDPVENASLLPWLAGTALLHSAIVVEKRDALKGWTVFLAIVTFALSLLGTFLVRSGVLTSVHAFATDPARGVFILGLLILIIGGALALFAWRGPSLQGGGLFQPVSREGALLLNNLLLTTAAATVLLGTLYPLILDAMGGSRISVGPPFFNAVFLPLMGPLVLAMAVGPLLRWKRGDLAAALSQLWGAGLAAIAVMVVAWTVYGSRAGLGLLGFGMAGWLLLGTLAELRQRLGLFDLPIGQNLPARSAVAARSLGMTLAHAGLAVAIAGMTGAGVAKDELILAMRPGEQATIAGYQLRFAGIAEAPGPNYRAVRGRFAVSSGGRPIAEMAPERRIYPVERRETTEAAIRTTMAGDLYVVVGATQEDGATVVRLYFNPLVAWIWSGAALMMLGGLVSLSDRRYRLSALPPAADRTPLPRRPRPDPAMPAARRALFLLPLLLFAGLALYFWAGLQKDPHVLPSVLIDQPVPPFALKPIQGRDRGFSSDDLKGQVSLVNVFGSWCAACKIEHPFLMRLAQDRVVPIHGIDWREKDPAAGPAWLARLGDPYTLIGDDPDSRAAIAFGVTGAPETFIVDRQGVIRYKQLGPITPEIWNATLWPIVERLRVE